MPVGFVGRPWNVTRAQVQSKEQGGLSQLESDSPLYSTPHEDSFNDLATKRWAGVSEGC